MQNKELKKAGKTIGNSISCPEENCKGKIVGYFYWTCTEKGCKKYDFFANAKCSICGYPRHNCCC